jgi:PST family polysaccharide transporter
MLSESIPMIIASLSVAAYMKVDQVIIGELINSSAVGVYSSAVKMSEVFYFIPTAFATSLYPKIVEKRESKDKKNYDKFKKKIYEYFALMAWLVTVPISILAPFIVKLLFGQEYVDASSVLSIHIWAFMFVCIGVVRSRQMIAEDKYKLIAASNFIGAISNIVLSVLLVYTYGIEGAAIATVLSYAISVWISNYLFTELNDLFYLISSSIVAPMVKIPKYLRAVFPS